MFELTMLSCAKSMKKHESPKPFAELKRLGIDSWFISKSAKCHISLDFN